jgi:hypothetical protein
MEITISRNAVITDVHRLCATILLICIYIYVRIKYLNTSRIMELFFGRRSQLTQKKSQEEVNIYIV